MQIVIPVIAEAAPHAGLSTSAGTFASASASMAAGNGGAAEGAFEAALAQLSEMGNAAGQAQESASTGLGFATLGGGSMPGSKAARLGANLFQSSKLSTRTLASLESGMRSAGKQAKGSTPPNSPESGSPGGKTAGVAVVAAVVVEDKSRLAKAELSQADRLSSVLVAPAATLPVVSALSRRDTESSGGSAEQTNLIANRESLSWRSPSSSVEFSAEPASALFSAPVSLSSTGVSSATRSVAAPIASARAVINQAGVDETAGEKTISDAPVNDKAVSGRDTEKAVSGSPADKESNELSSLKSVPIDPKTTSLGNLPSGDFPGSMGTAPISGTSDTKTRDAEIEGGRVDAGAGNSSPNQTGRSDGSNASGSMTAVENGFGSFGQLEPSLEAIPTTVDSIARAALGARVGESSAGDGTTPAASAGSGADAAGADPSASVMSARIVAGKVEETGIPGSASRSPLISGSEMRSAEHSAAPAVTIPRLHSAFDLTARVAFENFDEESGVPSAGNIVHRRISGVEASPISGMTVSGINQPRAKMEAPLANASSAATGNAYDNSSASPGATNDAGGTENTNRNQGVTGQDSGDFPLDGGNTEARAGTNSGSISGATSANPAPAAASLVAPVAAPVSGGTAEKTGTSDLPQTQQMLDSAPAGNAAVSTAGAGTAAASAHLASNTIPLRIEVGVHAGVFGNVQVRTSIDQSQVGISIRADHDIARWFSSEVGGLESGLKSQRLNLTSVDFSAARSSVQTGTGFQQGQPRQSFAQSAGVASARPTEPTSAKPERELEASATLAAAGPETRVSILA